MLKLHPNIQIMLQHFHLTDEDKRSEYYDIYEAYADLAIKIAHSFLSSPEVTVALRKLLESRDCIDRLRNFVVVEVEND